MLAWAPKLRHAPVTSACTAQVADRAHPTADAINTRVIDPAADAVEANARPLADKAIEQTLQPGSKALQEQAKPLADRIAKEAIQPAAQVCADYLPCHRSTTVLVSVRCSTVQQGCVSPAFLRARCLLVSDLPIPTCNLRYPCAYRQSRRMRSQQQRTSCRTRSSLPLWTLAPQQRRPHR